MNKATILLVSMSLIGCDGSRTEVTSADAGNPQTTLRYAEGFTVHLEGSRKIVDVKRAFQGATTGLRYVLVQRDDTVQVPREDAIQIRVPINSLVCTSTTHIPLLDYLEETDKLVGFPTPTYISSPRTRERIDEGEVMDLGIDERLNVERLAVLDPEMVMGYMLSSDYSTFRSIESLEIPVVINAEYLERHPLGRAEWIKFMALFFNKEREADSIFNAIEQSYLAAKAAVDQVQERPTVLSGIVYGDAWFLPGGNNYAAQLLKDAGCDYLWADNSSTGFLQLSFESVYAKAHDADLWIGVGDMSSLEDLKAADSRYQRFGAFARGSVYSYDAKKGAKGGNEYLELGYLRPDIILRDLIAIGHPGALENHALYFHRRLE
jgi:iron complex transport system substrate-binding protein